MKVVLQDGNKDCGICSLLSIIRFYGGDVSKEYLREITNTTKNGVSALGLIEGAKMLGFDAVGVCGDLNKIEDNNLPCLAHILTNKGFKHFIVIYKIDRDKELIYVMDPAKGKRILSFMEFKIISTNNYIFLKCIKKLPLLKPRKIIRREIINYLKNNKVQSIVLGGVLFLYFVLNIICCFHFKYLIEYSINFNVKTNIYFISSLVFMFYIYKNIFDLVRCILLDKWLLVLEEIITLKTLKQIFYLPYLFYKNRTVGEIISKIRDLNKIKNFIGKVFLVICSDLISLIIFIIFLFNINKRISIMIFIIFFIYIIFIICRNKFKKRFIRINNIYNDSVNSYLIEALSNVDTIKGCHLEKLMYDRFCLKYNGLLDSNYKFNRFICINNFFKNSVMSVIYIFVYGLGVYLVIDGEFSITDLYLYSSFFSYLLSSLNNIIDVCLEFIDFNISLKRVEDLFSIRKEEFLGSYFYYAYKLDGDICFNNLNYKIGSKVLFSNLKFNISYGEKILFSGESGSGKSTLMKILMRYIDIPYGYVSISNIDINHYHLENIRSNITYVSNNEYLFSDTLYNNIVFNREVSDDEFLEVCRISKIDFVDDYKVMVEENGFNFSNGERQRIILARSLLKKSSIYIFDEAFGNIDIESEKEIIKNIFKYLSDKTVIVISHRFNNKKLFDRVIELRDGIIYE